MITSSDHHLTLRITRPGTHIFYLSNHSADVNIIISCANARVFFYALYDLRGTQQYTLTTRQQHTAPRSISRVLVKSVLRGSSTLHHDGAIMIAEEASQSDATFHSHHLLIGRSAFAHAVPHLSVIPADVHCVHSATVHGIDETQRTYLRSRGVTARRASTLIARGFLDAVRRDTIAAQHSETIQTL